MKLIVVVSTADLRTAIEALDEKIKYSTHGDAVRFKNARAELQNILIKSEPEAK